MKYFLVAMLFLVACQGRVAEVAPRKQKLPSCYKKCRDNLERMDIEEYQPTTFVQCIYCLDELKTGFREEQDGSS